MRRDSDWNDMATAPLDGSTFLAKLSSGREVLAEWWEGPPGKEEEWGGWGICVTRSFCEGTMNEDCGAEMIGWRPLLPQKPFDEEGGIPQ